MSWLDRPSHEIAVREVLVNVRVFDGVNSFWHEPADRVVEVGEKFEGVAQAVSGLDPIAAILELHNRSMLLDGLAQSPNHRHIEPVNVDLDKRDLVQLA